MNTKLAALLEELDRKRVWQVTLVLTHDEYALLRSALRERECSATAPLQSRIVWPKERTVGRCGEMAPRGDMNLAVHLQDDGDVIVECWEVRHGHGERASVEFCTVGPGGGRSPRTRAALIALMVAIEADNAETPERAWPVKLAAAEGK